MHLLQVKEKQVLAFGFVCQKQNKTPKYIRGTNCATAGLKEVVQSPFEKVKTISKITFHI